jgi:hypothetical protein
MKTAWKYVILIGGLAGILGFFLPFARVTHAELTSQPTFSGYALVKGISKADFKAETEQLHASKADAEHIADELEHGLKEVAALVLVAYAPAAVLALLGVFGVVLRRYQRLAGLFGLLAGAASAGVWAILSAAAGKSHDQGASVSLAIGTHLLLVAGLCGIVAGLGALFAPDRG